MLTHSSISRETLKIALIAVILTIAYTNEAVAETTRYILPEGQPGAPPIRQEGSEFIAIGGDTKKTTTKTPNETTCFGSDCGKPETTASHIYTEREIKLIGELEVLKQQRIKINSRIQTIKTILADKAPKSDDQAEGEQKRKVLKGKPSHKKAKNREPEEEIDRVAKNYGEVELQDLTRLRVMGKPEVRWVGGKGATLQHVRVEVRNSGSYTAEEITVEAILPDGQKETLKGVKELEKYKEEFFEFNGKTKVRRVGKVKIELSCKNCRN
jgi:hypothetical protein